MTEHTGKAVGQQLGNYRLQRLLGTGGFADVYLAEHLHLRTLAAIKILHTKLTGEEAELFVQEARLIARLSHPHIIRVFDFDVDNMIPFLIMDYAPGGTLRQRHPKGTQVPLASIVEDVKQIADGLQYAHEQKLVHRDIKPENMLIDQHGDIVISDFGVASAAHSTESQTIVELAGTLPYIAPEQLQGLPRPASDQYALAIVVYEWISGTRPFQGTFAEIVSQHLVKTPPPLHGRIPGISQEVESVIFKAMSKDPRDRFATILEFAHRLERAYQGETTLQPQKGNTISINGMMDPETQPMPTEHIVTPATPFYATESPFASTTNSNTPPSSSYPSTFNFPQQPIPSPAYVEQPRVPLTSQNYPRQRWKAVAIIVPLLLILLSGGALYAFHRSSQTATQGGPAVTSSATAAESLTATVAPPTVNSQATAAAQQAAVATQTAVAQTQATAAAQQAAATQTTVARVTATAQASTPQELYKAVTSQPPSFNDSLGAQSARSWDSNAACVFSGGKYVISAPAGHFAPCLANSTNICNMGYQVQMTTLSGDGGGLIFRNATNGYRFRVGPDGSYDLAGTTTPNISGSSAAIQKGINATNQVTVIAQGSKISLYVNAQYITSVTDTTSNCGKIGLMAVGFGSTGSAAFSNATVWTL
jgi:serine/threonine-protein kinase